MATTTRAAALALALGLCGCGALERTTGWATGAVPIEPREAAGLTRSTVFLDLRPSAEYEAGHIPGAVTLAFEDVNGFLARLRQTTRETPVVLVCEDGIEAALAWPTAAVHDFPRAYALAGGMAAWRAQGLPLETRGHPPTERPTPPKVKMTRFAQVMNVAAALVIKPTYMLLALAMVFWLRKVRRSINVLWHGLGWFFVGEASCAIGLLWHVPGRLFPADAGHGLGMAAMSALVPWGLYAIFDEKVVRFSDPAAGCRFQSLCGHCWKRDPVRCRFHDLMLLMLPALAVVALLPLSGPLRPTQVVADVLGTPTDFGVPVVNLFLELRIFPVLASLGFLVTLAMMVKGKTEAVRRATPVFFASLGTMTYSLMRFLLSEAFREQFHWPNFWEELTEFVMVVALGAFLYLFRKPLGLVPGAAPVPPAGEP